MQSNKQMKELIKNTFGIKENIFEEIFQTGDTEIITKYIISYMFAIELYLLYLNDKDLKEAKRIIKAYLKEIDFGDLDTSALSLSRRIWIMLSKVSFFGTCELKNKLKKGIN